MDVEQIICEGGLITKRPKLPCKFNVTYVIDENSEEMYWVLQEMLK